MLRLLWKAESIFIAKCVKNLVLPLSALKFDVPIITILDALPKTEPLFIKIRGKFYVFILFLMIEKLNWIYNEGNSKFMIDSFLHEIEAKIWISNFELNKKII